MENGLASASLRVGDWYEISMNHSCDIMVEKSTNSPPHHHVWVGQCKFYGALLSGEATKRNAVYNGSLSSRDIAFILYCHSRAMATKCRGLRSAFLFLSALKKWPSRCSGRWQNGMQRNPRMEKIEHLTAKWRLSCMKFWNHVRKNTSDWTLLL